MLFSPFNRASNPEAPQKLFWVVRPNGDDVALAFSKSLTSNAFPQSTHTIKVVDEDGANTNRNSNVLYSNDDQLYVQQYDFTLGKYLPVFQRYNTLTNPGVPEGIITQFWDGSGDPYDWTLDQNGNIYSVGQNTPMPSNFFCKWDRATSTITQTSIIDDIEAPERIAFSPNENALFIANLSAFAASGEYNIGKFRTNGDDLALKYFADGNTVDLVIANSNYGYYIYTNPASELCVITFSLSTLSAITGANPINFGSNVYNGAAVNPQGQLYIIASNILYKYSPNGVLLDQVTLSPGVYGTIRHLSVDQWNRVYVTFEFVTDMYDYNLDFVARIGVAETIDRRATVADFEPIGYKTNW